MKKYAPPPERDPVPAMFVGDEDRPAGPLVPADAREAAEMLQADAREAAEMLPTDLRVEMEGVTPHRVGFVGAGVLAVAVFAMGIFKNVVYLPTDTQAGAFYALLGGCALIGVLGYRLFARHHREYRLADEGIVLETRYGADRTPWVTHVPWTETADYTVSITPDAATLRVVSVRGYTLTLRDRPPRLSTRELIRRFVEQVEHHRVAARPAHETAPPEDQGDSQASPAGCMAALAGILVMAHLGDLFTFSPGQRGVAFAGLVLAGCVLYLWYTLTDDDLAYQERTSRKLMARLRRWLRKVLGIRVI